MNKLTISKIGAIGFIVLLTLLHIINTSVNPIWQPISEYALGNVGWLMKVAFFSLGISFLFLGIYLIKKSPNTMLAVTDEVTRISNKGLTDKTFQITKQHFNKNEMAQIIIQISEINIWNRVAVATHMYHQG